MARQTGPEEVKTDSNAWMSTFSDLLMLMLTFFVLLLTMSSMDDKDINELMREGIHIQPSDDADSMVDSKLQIDRASFDTSIVELRQALDAPMTRKQLEQVGEILNQLLTAAGVSGSSWVEVRPEGVSIQIDATIGFVEGEARLTERATLLVEQLADTVGGAGLNIVVESYVASGNTWDDWDKAWELALMRADVVANTMIDNSVAPERMRIMGYGFAEGAEDGRFYRKSQLLRLQIITGEAEAEPGLVAR